MRRLGGLCGALAAASLRGGVFASLGAASVSMFVAPAFADGEQIVLPFQCTIERGRIVLTPSPEKTYRVVGQRASHAFTACAPANPERCRTWQIHKFDFLCAGQRVPWLAVAATMLERAPQRGRIENGRLMVRLGQQWQRADVVPAGFRHPFGEQAKLLAFPVGYAPSLGTGVRFIGAPPATVVDARPEPRADLKTEPKTPRAEAKPASAVERSAPAPKAPEQPISEGWVTTVTAVSADGSPADVTSTTTYILRGLFGLSAVCAAWAGLAMVRRRSGAVPTSDDQLSAVAPPPTTADDAALCAELVSRAVNLHQAARDAVGAVPNDNLREILTNDLAAVQGRLLSAELTGDVADERWHVVKPTVTQALGDLERIARIIAGVLSSRSSAAALATPAAIVPETAEQAYEALGINPDATRTVVKKVVDGLRQSWHPDHARDTDDRTRREERMKQINVAWALIRAEREPTTEEKAA